MLSPLTRVRGALQLNTAERSGDEIPPLELVCVPEESEEALPRPVRQAEFHLRARVGLGGVLLDASSRGPRLPRTSRVGCREGRSGDVRQTKLFK